MQPNKFNKFPRTDADKQAEDGSYRAVTVGSWMSLDPKHPMVGEPTHELAAVNQPQPNMGQPNQAPNHVSGEIAERSLVSHGN